MLGQKIRTLVNENQTANYYAVQWDGFNESGGKVASGIYLYRIEAEGPSASSGQRFVKTNKMLLLK
jgi:flagellar hook assembly protein FlgD